MIDGALKRVSAPYRLAKRILFFLSSVAQILILGHTWEPTFHFCVQLYQKLDLALFIFFCIFQIFISSKLKEIQASHLLHFKDLIKNLLDLPTFSTN